MEDDSKTDIDSELEEEEDDKKATVDVHISRDKTLCSELKKLNKHKKTGTVLQVHVDPQHTFDMDALRRFLCRVVGALPCLKKVEISTRHHAFGHIARWPLSLLTAMLDKAMQMRTKREIIWVRLCFLQLRGTWEDFQDLAKTLQSTKKLEKFNLDKISLLQLPGGPPTTHQGCWLDPLVQACAELPHLLHLRILGTRDFGNPSDGDQEETSVLQNSTLRQLCKSPSLRSLCLIHFNLTDDNVTHMVQELKTNQVLKELDIDCTLGKTSSCALVELMEHNSTLEDLNLCVRCKGDENEVAGNNSNVSEYDQQQKDAMVIEDEINERLANGVGKSSLVNFALFRGRISPQSQDAFRMMLSKQLHLESLTLYTGDEVLNKTLSEDPLISFYCRVNYHGRRFLLLDQPPTGRWKPTKWGKKGSRPRRKPALPSPGSVFAPELCLVDTLGRVKNDLPCLYYFLRAKPSLCDRALRKMNREEQDSPKKKRAASPGGAPPSKRTRLYRAAKYRSISYKCS